MLMQHVNFRMLNSFKNVTRRNIPFNKHFFDDGVISRHHAYLLGIVYGDGSIAKSQPNTDLNRFELTLQICDIDMLNSVRGILNSDHFISIGWNGGKTKGTWRPFATLMISDNHFASTLNDLGCVPRKCNKIRMPFDIVPEPYMWDFIRGYYETDGTHMMGKNGKCCIAFACNSDKFMYELHDFICSSLNVNRVTVHKRSEKAKQIKWAAADVGTITNAMYKDCDNSMVMTRKYEKHKMHQKIQNMRRRERVDIINRFKIEQMAFEICVTRDMICKSAHAISNNCRVFEQYRFRNQWIKMLVQFALTNDGYLKHDWQTCLRQWGSKWRYNEILAEVSDEIVYGYNVTGQ